MTEELKIALGLCVGLLTGYFGHACTVRRESLSRRRVFSGVLAIVHADLSDITEAHETLMEFYKNTRKTVLDECLKIRPDIAWWNRGGFDQASTDYREWETRTIESGKAHLGRALAVQPFTAESDKRTNKQKLK